MTPGGASGGEVFDLRELRDRTGVYRDRTQGGQRVAEMLEAFRGREALVLAVPAGGVPVGAAIAGCLELPLDVAVVSKLTPPWNPEVGYGAVAFDGTVRLNEPLVARLGLSQRQIAEGVARTTEKVNHRTETLRAGRGPLELAARSVILTDDGLASGFTMAVAVEAVRKAGAREVSVAVPTAHDRAAARVAPLVDAVYCPNVRSGWSFAVADAYRHWRDITEEQAAALLGP